MVLSIDQSCSVSKKKYPWGIRIAKENGCEVINVLDKNSPFYQTGPSEFLYLEKNAFLICTDSFHSSVFSILFNRPFIVFNREDINKSMNSRIDTLINKFELKNRQFENRITKENLHQDYTKAYEILEKEREKCFPSSSAFRIQNGGFKPQKEKSSLLGASCSIRCALHWRSWSRMWRAVAHTASFPLQRTEADWSSI